MMDQGKRTLFEVLAQAIASERVAQERYLTAAMLSDCSGRLCETFSRLATEGAQREAELRLRLAELCPSAAENG